MNRKRSPLIRSAHEKPSIAAPDLPDAPPKTPKPVKTRQAEYVARRRQLGFRRISLYIHETDFGEGYNLGRAEKPLTPPRPGQDPVSFMLGWTDGLWARALKQPGLLARRIIPAAKEE